MKDRYKRILITMNNSLASFKTMRQHLDPVLQSPAAIIKGEAEINKFLYILADFIHFSEKFIYNDEESEKKPTRVSSLSLSNLVIQPSMRLFRRYVLRKEGNLGAQISLNVDKFDGKKSKNRVMLPPMGREEEETAEELMERAAEAKEYALRNCQFSIDELEQQMSVQRSQQPPPQQGEQSREE